MENEKNVIDEVNDTSEVENQEQEIKTYSEEEVEAIKAQLKDEYEASFDDKFNRRWGNEKRKIERDNAEKDELIDLLRKQTGKDSLSDLLNMSYEQYGMERPSIFNSKDEEILGKYDAKEILELDDETIEEEANRLANIEKRTAREQATFMELGNYLTTKKQEQKLKNEIKEAGIDEQFLDDSSFKEFMGKFNKETPLKEIVDIYNLKNGEVKKKPFSPGSLKDKKTKDEAEFFTEEEFNALTREDLKNPMIYRKAMKSKERF